jgi:HTH-type transcriptional regulator/antitoxin HigA
MNIQQTVTCWAHIAPYICPSHNEKEHKQQLTLLRGLVQLRQHDKSTHLASLIKIIAKNIQAYESTIYPPVKCSPIELLKFLMDQHGLKQSDLPEIGSRTLVSKILSGKRNLTAEQIGKLAKRFHVSTDIFYS